MGEVLIFCILRYPGNQQHFNMKYVLVRYKNVEIWKKHQITMTESKQFNFEVNKTTI